MSLMSPISISPCLPRFIGMKFKAVTFFDSSFLNCYFEDVSSVGSSFKNCTFVDSFFYNTGESLREGRFFPSITGNTVWHISLTDSTLVFGLMSELSVREPGFHHLWLCFIPLNYSLTSLPLHRLPFRTQWPAVKSETEPDFYYIWCFKCFWRN